MWPYPTLGSKDLIQYIQRDENHLVYWFSSEYLTICVFFEMFIYFDKCNFATNCTSQCDKVTPMVSVTVAVSVNNLC